MEKWPWTRATATAQKIVLSESGFATLYPKWSQNHLQMTARILRGDGIFSGPNNLVNLFLTNSWGFLVFLSFFQQSQCFCTLRQMCWKYLAKQDKTQKSSLISKDKVKKIFAGMALFFLTLLLKRAKSSDSTEKQNHYKKRQTCQKHVRQI